MHMDEGAAKRTDELERLSALLDGELGAPETAGTCARWLHDAELRVHWQQWSLIGDVLRSDDLASHPQRDAQFLTALRGRLATEPVVLAPPVRRTPLAELRRHSRWVASSAVAAGFVAVAGTALVLREPAPGAAPVAQAPQAVQAAPVMAAAPTAPTAPVQVVSTAPAAAETPPVVVNPTMIRDARLDRYLAAHKQFAGSSALGVPSGYLRAATADAAAR